MGTVLETRRMSSNSQTGVFSLTPTLLLINHIYLGEFLPHQFSAFTLTSGRIGFHGLQVLTFFNLLFYPYPEPSLSDPKLVNYTFKQMSWNIIRMLLSLP